MDYSKDSRSEKIKSSNTNKKKKKAKKAKVTVFRVIVVILIVGLFALVGAGLGIFIGIIKSAPDISTLELKPTTNYTSFVYDDSGNEIDTLSTGENRIYVTLDKIPKHLQDAVVAIEDERFWDHHGIDPIGIMRAIVKNLKSGELTEGASTITQQLIKNNILTSEKSFVRKIQEQYLALQFDALYDKELILEYYLNTMPLGHGQNGVQAAAKRYYGKDVSELTLAESVVIAGITQAPTRYSPILNPEKNHEKSQIILNKMVEQGYITEAERQAALEENPYKNILEVNEQQDDSPHTYFVDAVIDQVITDLQEEKGMTQTQANNLLFGGGVKIYTTQATEMQRIVDENMNNDDLFPAYIEYVVEYSATIEKADGSKVNKYAQGVIKEKDELEMFKTAKQEGWELESGDKIIAESEKLIPQAQAAFVIMDQYNGHVKALSGGRGEKYGNRTFNRATQAKRQPGSTFKVLAAYAPALDTGVLSPGSVIVDEPYTVGKYSPKNWYSGYRGPSTVRQGIYDSMNILAVKTVDMVGIETAYNYLLNFGFTTLKNQDKVYALPLGGLTDGVTPLELNAAYASIANNGTYTEPILYTKVLDRDGVVLLDHSAPETHTVLSASTASMLTNMMEDTISKGTGGSIRNIFNGMHIAGKTGTTSDNKDFLFAGYTPYYTATVWMGYDNPQSFNCKSAHLKLWATIMSEIHEELPDKNFELITTGYTKTSICGASGKIPTDLCKLDSDNKIASDYFQKSQAPTEYCDIHIEESICKASGKIATEFCPLDQVETRVIKRTSSSEVKPEELCDIHTSLTPTPENPTNPSWPDWLPEWPGTSEPKPENGDNNLIPDGGTTEEQTPPAPPTNPNPKPDPTPSPDDESGFFIPQN